MKNFLPLGKNTRKHPRSRINKYLLFCIDTDETYNILDKTSHSILKVSHSPSVDCLMEIISKIDWNQKESILIAELKNKIASFNKKPIPQGNLIESPSSPKSAVPSPAPYIDSFVLASGLLTLMQHGRILPKDNFAAIISVHILLKQISKYDNAFDKPTICEKEIKKQFLEFIGQLCKDGMIESARAIHNYLHFGYLIAKTKENGMNSKKVSKILGPNLLDGLQIDSFIFNNKHENFKEDFWGTSAIKEEYKLISQITNLLLLDDCFSTAFNALVYDNYAQPNKARLKENNNLYQLLWHHVNYNLFYEERLGENNNLRGLVYRHLKPVNSESLACLTGSAGAMLPPPKSTPSSPGSPKRRLNKSKKKNRSAILSKGLSVINYPPSEKADDDSLIHHFESLTYTPSHNQKKSNRNDKKRLTANPRPPLLSRTKNSGILLVSPTDNSTNSQRKLD